ncbi:MAG: hypothetical protein EU530_01680 [Promethearchaeota archaeon]|nr:MAG: hypothetical protein EU530_01680 [Candidatus Lokiarchaeota archaeon]
MDKKLRLTIILGFVVVIAVPSFISLGYVIKNTGIFDIERMINESDNIELVPTPNSNISVEYSILESKNTESFHYDFEFLFNIIHGIEPNFTYHDQIYNETQLYLTIKANHGLEFFTFFSVLNMTKFQEDNSQIIVQKVMDSSQRFENLNFKIEYDSLSINGSITIIGGAKVLTFREAPITAEDISQYSGIMHFWINENSYNLSYTITSNFLMTYTLNSFVTDNPKLQMGNIQIIGWNGTRGSGVASIGFPCTPWASPGYYSTEKNTTFSLQYPYIIFEFNVGVNYGSVDVRYEIIPLSEIKDERIMKLRNTLLITTGSTLLLYLIVISCMINQERKYDIFWYSRK